MPTSFATSRDATPGVHVFCEAGASRAVFETAHPFETERDAFENGLWFDGQQPALSVFAPMQTFDSMNSAEAVKALREFRADLQSYSEPGDWIEPSSKPDRNAS